MDFVAIDFETANHRRDSACQLAAVVVSGGEIVGRQKWMIRPRPFYFSPRCIEVHGILPDQVAGEPEFGELWGSIAPFLEANCLVAHNAPFDIGVLVECLRAHQLATPELNFTCTRLISRAVWPGQSGYGLKSVATRLGITFRHHDALEDSLACAKILLAAAKVAGVEDLPSLELKYKLARGTANAAGYQGAKRATRARHAPSVAETKASYSTSRLPFAKSPAEAPPAQSPQPEPSLDLHRLLLRADFLKRLAGKRVVLSGRLKMLSVDDAKQLAVRLGASVQPDVNDQTDMVIVGEAWEPTRVDTESKACDAMDAAQRLIAGGCRIELLTEADFLGLVSGQR
jgi:DNA polymerase-3 subunit epsilon